MTATHRWSKIFAPSASQPIRINSFWNETPTVRGLAAINNKKIVHGNYDLLME